MENLTNPIRIGKKYVSDKEKKLIKSARISFRTELKNRAEFLQRVKKLGCSQDALFSQMLWDSNNSALQKIPPTAFVQIDEAINEIEHLSKDPEIQKNIAILRTGIRNLKSNYGWGYYR